MVITTSVCLPEWMLELIEEIKRGKGDSTRSETIRSLLMQSFAALSYLPDESKKALGIREMKNDDAEPRRRDP